MLDWLNRFGQYIARVLMPARFRKSALEYQVISGIDQTAANWENPEAIVETAADETATTIEEQTEEAQDAAEERKAEGGGKGGGEGEGEAKTAQPPPEEKESVWWTVLRWVLHVLLVIAVLVGLYFLNWWLGLAKILRSDFPYLHAFWLPILFFILYILFWLGLWLWQMNGPEQVGLDFPDITSAWDTAVSMLYRSGIDIQQAPVFLVLGQAQGSESQFFGTPSLRLTISAPRSGTPPVRVFANQDRIFVTCPGASVLAHFSRFLTNKVIEEKKAERAAKLAQQRQAVGVTEGSEGGIALEGGGGVLTPEPQQFLPPENVYTEIPAEATEPPLPEPSDQLTETQAPVTQNNDQPNSPDNSSEEMGRAIWEEEEKRVFGLASSDDPLDRDSDKKDRSSFLKNLPQVRWLTTRLHNLCRLILNTRQPYTPINGILILVPYLSTLDDESASQAATACRYDMTSVFRAFRVQCPVFALVCNMEQSEGFRQFVGRLPTPEKISRLGQKFPLCPDLDEREVAEMVEQGMGWLSDALLPSLVYNLFRLEGPVPDRRSPLSIEEATEGNVRLYEFLGQVRNQRQRLAKMLTRGLLLDTGGFYHFGGVYLAGTGSQMRAFLSGVFGRLLENQNYVSWAPEAIAADRRYRVWSWLLFLLNLALLLGGPVLAYFFWPW